VGEHLTPLDATFLELEEGDESAHMHVGWAMIFAPLPAGGTPSLTQVRELLDRRLALLPRFRRRLSSPRTGRFSWPSWIADPGFDVANHVRQATLPAPAGEAELLEWLGDFYSHRLDRAHPLWETVLLDGFADGGWAMATKVHHSLVDGISGNSVTAVILDAEPDPAPGSRGVLEGLAAVEERGAEHGHDRLSALAGAARAGADTVLHPRKLGALIDRSREIAGLLVDELISAPHTSLNVEIGGSRRLAAVNTSLDSLKQVKNELGGTVNDVVLAATAGGLRRLFEQRGEDLEAEALRVMVPVSVRGAGEQLALGNRVSSLFVDLPIAEPDPLLRYRKTVAASRELKGGGQSRGGEALVELAGAAPPLVHGVVARLAFTPRLFNLTITNVPGVQTTLYALGAPLQRVVPLVPIFAGHAVGVAVVSYDGKVAFGINADRVEVPDIDAIRDGIEQSLAELRELATGAAKRDDAAAAAVSTPTPSARRSG
jgi:diacylglycerol O-acyltransferase / wax synthase